MDRISQKHWLWALFLGYCGMMLWLLLLHRIDGEYRVGQYNLQPLDTVRRYLWVLRNTTDAEMRNNALANLFGNVALFVPLGIFLPLLFAGLRRFWRFGLLTLGLILALEFLQLATGLGTLDVDDLLLNIPGALLGYWLWRLLQKTGTNNASRA